MVDGSMMNKVFVDAAFAIALASPRDRYHSVASALAADLRKNNSMMVTTVAVLLEIGNALSRRRHRQAGKRIIQSLRTDSMVEVIQLDDDLVSRGFALFSSRDDKEWSITDCISFAVMASLGTKEALTPDKHFVQAGFSALMLA